VSSQNIVALSKAPVHRGAIFQVEADERGLVLLEAKEKSLKVYFLIDPETDHVLEAKFFTYGGPVYTAIAEVLCRKFEDQALFDAVGQWTPEAIEKELRDNDDAVLDIEGPELSTINPLYSYFKTHYEERKSQAMVTRQIRKKQAEENNTAFEIKSESDAEWAAKSKVEQISKVNEVLDAHVRQGLQMDGGDIEVLDIVDNIKVIAEYQGACGSCGSAVGGTLFFIEDTLRKHVHPKLKVEPRGLTF